MYLLGTAINNTYISFEAPTVHIAAKTKCKALDTVRNLLFHANECGEVNEIRFCTPPYAGRAYESAKYLQDMVKNQVFIDPERPGIKILDNLIADICAKGEDMSSVYYIVDAELFDDVVTKKLRSRYNLIRTMSTVHNVCCLIISRDTRASDTIDVRIKIDDNDDAIIKSGILVVTAK